MFLIGSYSFQLSSNNHGLGDSLELYSGDGRHVLDLRGVPTSSSWSRDYCSCRGLGMFYCT